MTNFDLKTTKFCLIILFVTKSSTLKWYTNTAAIYRKSMGRMWLLRRMKTLNLELELILDYYLKEIRPLTEQGVVVWNSGLTKSQVNDLEKIQKVALTIILGGKYLKYEESCEYFNISKLSSRRADLCAKFAVKLYLSPRCKQFFTCTEKGVGRNNDKFLVKENTTRTNRCFNAPHNYLARLVNQNSDLIAKNFVLRRQKKL